jgi:hypothetical protein
MTGGIHRGGGTAFLLHLANHPPVPPLTSRTAYDGASSSDRRRWVRVVEGLERPVEGGAADLEVAGDGGMDSSWAGL